eukprot:CAMPEP_0176135508 /NCGR_PEP_ID=MMETSP0120_2-20121206/68746_1 /TAXON_ID=160619 /ORGANISM="Kryptoperidinium foliaceum, Strain CCMP 1326" /LENGTH=58 /DNA_ID=CAMNT_0017471225 /DNA_START=111 /DNA_END=284 /DNA_ORIENTATION=+
MSGESGWSADMAAPKGRPSMPPLSATITSHGRSAPGKNTILFVASFANEACSGEAKMT